MHSLGCLCLQENSQNAEMVKLLSCNFDREVSCNSWFCILMFCKDALCQIWPLVCKRVTLLGNYCFSRQIAHNSKKQFISTKTTIHNFLAKCTRACMAFNWVSFTTKKKRMQKGLSSLWILFLCSVMLKTRFINEKLSYFKNKTQLCDPFDNKLRNRFIVAVFAYHICGLSRLSAHIP